MKDFLAALLHEAGSTGAAGVIAAPAAAASRLALGLLALVACTLCYSNKVRCVLRLEIKYANVRVISYH